MVPESKPAIAPNPSNPGQMQINIEELQKHNIFFATPCYGGQLTDQFFLSMFRLTQALNHYKINYRITTLRNESLVTRARNILTAMFLESDCTHLMFIDADIEFEPDSVIRMLAMNKPLIAAAYPKKTIDWDNVRKKREEFDALVREVNALKKSGAKKSPVKKTAAKKPVAKKSAVKKSTVKKSAVKKASK